MTNPPLVSRLAALPGFADVPQGQLEWLAAHGEVRQFASAVVFSQEEPGGIVASSGPATPGLFIVLDGHLSVRRADRTGPDREIRELRPGSVSGMLPYSRLKNAQGYIVADVPSEILLIAADDVREMTRECYDFTARCVHEMLDRVRLFKSDDLQQEKMASLGRLSAGIAHELNNPSSAIGQSAREVDACRSDLVKAARALGAAALTGDRLAAFEALDAAASRTPDATRSALERADREDEIGIWLSTHGIDTALTDRLANTDVGIADLDAARAVLLAGELTLALHYVAANVTAGRLTAEIENAARRIHSLVAAVKKHTHMDRAPTVEPIQLDTHLRDTLTLVGARAHARGLRLDLVVANDLPPVRGVVGELNQVWLNLLDNAIDAAPDNGHVSVEAVCERGAVTVRVIDDGPGVAEGDLPHIFDPFFTTKPVGQGAGLGLDVVRTIVRNHRGSVDVDSRPGRTEFRVSLPVDSEQRC